MNFRKPDSSESRSTSRTPFSAATQSFFATYCRACILARSTSVTIWGRRAMRGQPGGLQGGAEGEDLTLVPRSLRCGILNRLGGESCPVIHPGNHPCHLMICYREKAKITKESMEI